MKVAFVIGKFPSLSETFILNQITGLLERGHEVDIYADQPDNQSMHEDVTRYKLLDRTHYRPRLLHNPLLRLLKGVVLLATYGWKDPKRAIKALNVWRYGRHASSLRLLFAVIPFLGESVFYDVLHCHFGPFGLRGMFLRDVAALSGKLVITFHGADLTKDIRAFGPELYRRLFKSGDLFLPISEFWEQRLKELGCPSQKIKVHRMGIDCKEFAFSQREIGTEVTRLVSVCRLVEKKGIEYAIRAVAAVVRTGRAVQYDIIGDGPLRPHLSKLVEQLAMSSFVTIHGSKRKPEVVAMLMSSHMLLAPSVTAANGDQEGIPVALMEAMATGLPVVSTWHSGIPELVSDGESGFLVEERDVGSLEERLIYLLDHPDIRARMGQRGRMFVEAQFEIDKLNDRLVEIFTECLNNRNFDKSSSACQAQRA